MNLGINTVHFDVKSIRELKFNMVEVVLGRSMPYSERIIQLESEMERINAFGLKLSVHHPIYIPEWFCDDYLDAFFLDLDSKKRERSFRLLEENLRRCQIYHPEYVVIHFPGVYEDDYMEPSLFEALLKSSVEEIEYLAARYDTKVLFEYFGSNGMFYKIEDWINVICKFDHLSILVDTGHLCFAAHKRNFDFNEAFETLAAICGGFHLWTVKGKETYFDNGFYKNYHHIMPSKQQKMEEGWAFDLTEILEKIISTNQPLIIEASPIYGGVSYFLRSIEEVIKFCEERGYCRDESGA